MILQKQIQDIDNQELDMSERKDTKKDGLIKKRNSSSLMNDNKYNREYTFSKQSRNNLDKELIVKNNNSVQEKNNQKEIETSNNNKTNLQAEFHVEYPVNCTLLESNKVCVY